MKHILIVDDDIHINKMLDEVLVHERYMVSHAYSGTEALLFLADTKPDLILLDLMLPGLSGEELLPQISDMAGLSFLGLGAQRPTAEWGVMMSEARNYMQTAPWIIIFPGLALFLTVIVFNRLGDSVRDVLNKRSLQGKRS